MRSHFFWVVWVVLVVVPACSDLGDPPRSVCDLPTNRIDYGSVEVGFFADRTLSIRNDGNAPLTGTVSLSGPHYALLEGDGPFVVEPEEQLQIVVRFAPADTGSHRAELELGDGCPPVSLEGIGGYPSAGPRCVVDPAALDFGEVAPGETVDRSFEIRNVGLVAFPVDIAAPCAGDFDVISGGGSYVLAAGDTLRATVRFAPAAAGDYACDLTTGTDCASMTCTGVATAPVTVSFATDVQPIFNTRCILCHDQTPEGGLNLMTSASYRNLVGVVSRGYAPALRVSPGNPGASVLYGKVTGSGQYGQRMPPPGNPQVPLAETETIRTWILEGALNN